MAGTAQSAKNSITLKGSAEIVAEFFTYGVNSILYQRGIYPPETFQHVSKYDLTLLMTSDTDLVAYLSGVMKQIREWLAAKVLQRMVVVITRVDTQETLERWQFDIDTDKTVTDDSSPRSKPLKEIQKEIRDVIRQITASVTFLPLLDCPCSFNILIYTDKESEVPESFEESGPMFIANSQEVRLRSFTTTVHKVDTVVCYKVDD